MQHFDCRPPTCLSQSTRVLTGATFPTADLVTLRYPVLLPSPASADGFVLVGRSSLGTVSRTSVTLTAKSVSSHFVAVPVNLVGPVRTLVPTLCGEAVLAVGRNGRIQNWETGEDDLVVETFVSDVSVGEGAEVATWHDGRMVAVVGVGKVEVYSFEPNGRLARVAAGECGLADVATLFVARTEEDSPNTTIVGVTGAGEVTTWTYSASRQQVYQGSTQVLLREGQGKAGVALTAAVPVREYKDREEEASLLVVDDEGTFAFWTMDLSGEDDEWRAGAAVKTGRRGVRLGACSADRLTALVVETEEGSELSIWDSDSSEFATGQQFAQVLKSVWRAKAGVSYSAIGGADVSCCAAGSVW